MDNEIKDIIEEYVGQIENKEADIVSLKKEIDIIIDGAKKDMASLLAELDKKFDEGGITEQEYMDMARKEKELILEKAKGRLDLLVHEIKN